MVGTRQAKAVGRTYVDQCVIRVLGDEFDPDRFLATTTLTPSSIFHKGELRAGRRRPARTGGFTCDLGTGGLPEQIRSASEFISRHASELRRISTTTTVESFFVDFAYECRLDDESAIVQRDFLPAEFLRLVGDIGLAICLSQYKPDCDETHEVESDTT
jgi:hypothetical protein